MKKIRIFIFTILIIILLALLGCGYLFTKRIEQRIKEDFSGKIIGNEASISFKFDDVSVRMIPIGIQFIFKNLTEIQRHSESTSKGPVIASFNFLNKKLSFEFSERIIHDKITKTQLRLSGIRNFAIKFQSLISLVKYFNKMSQIANLEKEHYVEFMYLINQIVDSSHHLKIYDNKSDNLLHEQGFYSISIKNFSFNDNFSSAAMLIDFELKEEGDTKNTLDNIKMPLSLTGGYVSFGMKNVANKLHFRCLFDKENFQDFYVKGDLKNHSLGGVLNGFFEYSNKYDQANKVSDILIKTDLQAQVNDSFIAKLKNNITEYISSQKNIETRYGYLIDKLDELIPRLDRLELFNLKTEMTAYSGPKSINLKLEKLSFSSKLYELNWNGRYIISATNPRYDFDGIIHVANYNNFFGDLFDYGLNFYKIFAKEIKIDNFSQEIDFTKFNSEKHRRGFILLSRELSDYPKNNVPDLYYTIKFISNDNLNNRVGSLEPAKSMAKISSFFMSLLFDSKPDLMKKFLESQKKNHDQ